MNDHAVLAIAGIGLAAEFTLSEIPRRHSKSLFAANPRGHIEALVEGQALKPGAG